MNISFLTKVKVLIADDHEFVRKGVRAMMRTEDSVEVVGEAATGLEVLQQTEKLGPDVVILDLVMPGMEPVELIQHIRGRNPATRVLILSMYDSGTIIRNVMAAGANGYILKSDVDNFRNAFHAVCRGQRYLSREVSELLAYEYLGLTVPPKQNDRFSLTRREGEVARLLSLGKSSKEIGHFLTISVRTVETHRANIMRKLNVHSVTELLHSAHSRNLIQ